MSTTSHAAAARFGQAGDANAVHVIQGEQRISEDPEVVLTTILGSCVAACLRDPMAGIGGMNHFLLPGETSDGGPSGSAERYGVHAMELLVNGLLQRGAVRSRLEAKLFGGAKTMSRLSDIGALNARFASQFLQRERINVVGECLMGTRGRRVQYWPISGRARRIFLPFCEEPIRPVVQPATDSGTLDLF